MSNRSINEIQALIVRQWLKEWDEVHFSADEHRRKPEPQFFLFSLPALHLRKLAKVYQRRADRPRAEDMAIQRTLESGRAEEIGRFIRGGYPWSELSDRQKEFNEYRDLRMPGWLPTSIVANILPEGAKRDNVQIETSDLIKIEYINDQFARLILPDGYLEDNWTPVVPPIEIIDGQHRLFSFLKNEDIDGYFDLPVVAFNNLDFTWQAYLFYTINIKPKKINTSLAYDLYPLLRIQDWLEKSPSGPTVYRATRAQELTEILWSHPKSPWKSRINMLGEKKGGDVTQAAFIRSLMASYVRRGKPIGGLFGDELHPKRGDILKWSRVKQAAFIILVWIKLKDAIENTQESWAVYLRNLGQKRLPLSETDNYDLAFSGDYSLLATDQGVRGILQVTNDMCFVAADLLEMEKWLLTDNIENGLEDEAISEAIESLENQPVSQFLSEICRELTEFDWRTSSTPKLPDQERRAQMVYKGSGGYKEMRGQLVQLLCASDNMRIREIANRVKYALK